MRGPSAAAAKAIAWLVCSALLACSPTLNWREVPLGRLTTLLPCKPDNANRSVVLGAVTVSMEMAGCEVAGTLYAISRVQGEDAPQAERLMNDLRQASLINVGVQVVHPMANSGDAQTSFDVLVDGRHANGSAMQARFKWLLAGVEVYQIAAYADHLGAEQTESLLREAHVR